MARARRPELYADAAYAVITRPSRDCTGNAFLCEDVLAAEGVTDFDRTPTSPAPSRRPTCSSTTPERPRGGRRSVFQSIALWGWVRTTMTVLVSAPRAPRHAGSRRTPISAGPARYGSSVTGCSLTVLRRTAVRWCSVVPPQMPWTCSVRRANARHSRRTRQVAQIRFGLHRLLQGWAGIRDRKEQIGVGQPAGGNQPPLSAGDEPRRPGLANLLAAFTGSAHQSASSTSAAARGPAAIHIIQFTAPGRGSIVGPACRGVTVSYGSSEAFGVAGPGRHVLSTVLSRCASLDTSASASMRMGISSNRGRR